MGYVTFGPGQFLALVVERIMRGVGADEVPGASSLRLVEASRDWNCL